MVDESDSRPIKSWIVIIPSRNTAHVQAPLVGVDKMNFENFY
jgi:hypothetical protein